MSDTDNLDPESRVLHNQQQQNSFYPDRKMPIHAVNAHAHVAAHHVPMHGILMQSQNEGDPHRLQGDQFQGVDSGQLHIHYMHSDEHGHPLHHSNDSGAGEEQDEGDGDNNCMEEADVQSDGDNLAEPQSDVQQDGHPGFDKQGTQFKRLIKDQNDHSDREEGIRRVILCSGKVYYELVEERERVNGKDVAICRVEQLCPFPYNLVQRELKRYPSRAPSAATTTGFSQVHVHEQRELVQKALQLTPI